MSYIPKPTEGDVSIAPSLLESAWTLYTVSSVIIALRLAAQVKVFRRFRLSDYLMVLCLLIGIINISLATKGTEWGLGRHYYYLSTKERIMAIKYEYLSQPFGIACPTFGRISFAVYMLGLIGPVKWRRWLLHGLIWSQVIVNSVTIILIFVQCEHVDAIWDREGAGGWCWDASVNTDFGYFQGAVNSLTDFLLTIMPTVMLWNLKLAMRLKVGLAVLLGLSAFAMIASIVKTVELRGIADRYDFTHNMISFIIWCSVENNIVMISSSIPMIRPLWVRRKGSSYELGTYVSDPSGYGGGTRGRPHTHPDPQTVYASPRVFHKPAAVVTGSGSRSADSPSNSSEENILGTSGHGRNIIKSTTVAVEYDRDDGSHGTGKQVPSYGF